MKHLKYIMFFLSSWSNFYPVSLNHRVQLPRQERFLSQQCSLTGWQDPSAVCASKSGAALVSYLLMQLRALLSSLASRKDFFFFVIFHSCFLEGTFLQCGSYIGWTGDYKIVLKAPNIFLLTSRCFTFPQFELHKRF